MSLANQRNKRRNQPAHPISRKTCKFPQYLGGQLRTLALAQDHLMRPRIDGRKQFAVLPARRISDALTTAEYTRTSPIYLKKKSRFYKQNADLLWQGHTN